MTSPQPLPLHLERDPEVSTLLWDLCNEAGRDNKLTPTPALDRGVDQLEQKLLAKYFTQEDGWYSENLQ